MQGLPEPQGNNRYYKELIQMNRVNNLILNARISRDRLIIQFPHFCLFSLSLLPKMQLFSENECQPYEPKAIYQFVTQKCLKS